MKIAEIATSPAHRMVVRVERTTAVHVDVEYQIGNGEWRIDPEAGVCVRNEHLDWLIGALTKAKASQNRSEE